MVLQHVVFVEVVGGSYKGCFGTVLQEKGTSSVLLELSPIKQYVTIRRHNVIPYYDVMDVIPLPLPSFKKQEDQEKESDADNDVDHEVQRRFEALTKQVAKLNVQVNMLTKSNNL